MYSEPKNQADILQDAAAMANGNLRLSRVLNILLLHLANKPPAITDVVLGKWEESACSALSVLATYWEEPDEQALRAALSRLEEVKFGSFGHQNPQAWVYTQLVRASTELSAMLLEALPASEPST
jgi:hypothetical protein